jgi:hypothetical protein
MGDNKKQPQLDIFEQVAAKYAPDHYEDRQQEAEPTAGEASKEPAPKAPPQIEELAEVIRLPDPSDAEHALAAVPVVRHWLFAPDRTRERYREFEVETTHQQRRIKQAIRIGDRFAEAGKGYGVLTARHQGALFALQRIWQTQGGRMARVDGARRGVLCLSSYILEKEFFGHHGGRTRRLIRQIIQELSSIPVAIDNYIGPDGEIYDLDISGLIGGAEFRTSRRGAAAEQLVFPWVEIYLSSIVTRAFELQAVKPLNLAVLNDLGSGIPALLYPKVDYLLANNPETEMRLGGLIQKLGLADKRMSQAAYRRRKFASYARELDGQPLSRDGYIIDARLEPTADKADHKLIFARRKK